MDMRIEKRDALPPAHASKLSRWQPIESQLRATPVGGCLVVVPGEYVKAAWKFHIEKFARCRGFKVNVHMRVQEIWIERLG